MCVCVCVCVCVCGVCTCVSRVLAMFLKDVINNLFQFCATNAFFHVAVGDLEVHALILCNRCLFDIQNQSPAVVVYFCFPELPTLTRLVPKWPHLY